MKIANDSKYPDFGHVKNNKKEIIEDDDEIAEIGTILIEFIKNIAILENKKKIIIDVHSNLRIYNKYYKKDGFILTNRKCKENGLWLEAEIVV